MIPGTGTWCPCGFTAALLVGVLVCTATPLYLRTFWYGTPVRACSLGLNGAGGQVPASHCPRHGVSWFFEQLQRRQPASLPLPSLSPLCAGKPWGLRLFRYGETNPVHSSISSYRHYRHTISPKAEPFWGLGNRQSLDLSEIFPGCLGCLDPSSRLPLVTQRHSQQMPVGLLLSRLRKDCNVTAPPPKPQRVKEKFSVPDLSGLSGTGSGTGTCLFPSMTSRRLQLGDIDRPIITDRMDGRTVSLVAGQYCMSRTVSVIGSFSHKEDRPGTLHVARCLSLVTRRSLPLGRVQHKIQPTSQSLTQSTHKGPGTPGTKHFEDEMQLHVLHHMDDRGSHE